MAPTLSPLISLHMVSTEQNGNEDMLSHGRVYRNNGRNRRETGRSYFQLGNNSETGQLLLTFPSKGQQETP